MNTRTWVKYLVYMVLLASLIFLKEYVNGLLKANFSQTFHVNLYFLAIATLINIAIGLLLGFEHLFGEAKKAGTWKINVPKITLMGLPSLYFSVINFIGYSNIEFLSKILLDPFMGLLLKFGINSVPIFQVLLGYVIITSFNKKNENFDYRHKIK